MAKLRNTLKLAVAALVIAGVLTGVVLVSGNSGAYPVPNTTPTPNPQWSRYNR